MQIRHPHTGDEIALAHLLEEMQRHYGHSTFRGVGAPGAAFLISPPHGGTMCLVAEDEGRLLGFAILTPYFPADDLSHGLFLKELYVAAHARSEGVGEHLIDAIRELAQKRGDTRVIWTTSDRNKDAQRFYDRLGARREGKVYYVLDGW
jgi:GNAT superfamily N-acetyltransferase